VEGAAHVLVVLRSKGWWAVPVHAGVSAVLAMAYLALFLSGVLSPELFVARLVGGLIGGYTALFTLRMFVACIRGHHAPGFAGWLVVQNFL
jgi:hypothetical protein